MILCGNHSNQFVDGMVKKASTIFIIIKSSMNRDAR